MSERAGTGGLRKATFDSPAVEVLELDPDLISPDLRTAVLNCVSLQKASIGPSEFRPEPAAMERVSAAELMRVLERGDDVHGVASDRSISNALVFSATRIHDAVRSQEVEQAREVVDRGMERLILEVFDDPRQLECLVSGHLWYPPGSFMGWHTNSRVPGWRAYVTYAETAGRSFFRYYDNRRDELVTLMDRDWNLRLFRISSETPLWHAVYSDTDRFSFGYMIRKRQPQGSIMARLAGWARRGWRDSR